MEVVEEYKLLGSETVAGLAMVLLPWLAGIANRVNRVLPKDGTEAMLKPLVLKTFTVATVPTAGDWTDGIIIVSDETGGATVAFSDGTNWRRLQDLVVVS